MTVELLITRKDTGSRELVPVATSEVFRNYWTKGCTELALQLVPRFEDGILDFSGNEVERVIDELIRLKAWFTQTQTPSAASALNSRVDNLVEAFTRVLHDSNLSIG